MTHKDASHDMAVLTDSERAAAYGMLSDIFARELTAERITALAEASKGPAAVLASRSEFAGMFAQLEQMAREPEAAEREQAGVFAFLFLGVGGRRSAPPYESVYGDDKGRTNQSAAGAMSGILTRLNLKVLRNFPEPPDHISVELAVAGALADAGAQSGEQSAFLKARLAGWLGDFAAACDRGDRSGFYARAARAAKEFTLNDLKQLQGSNLENKENGYA